MSTNYRGVYVVIVSSERQEKFYVEAASPEEAELIVEELRKEEQKVSLGEIIKDDVYDVETLPAGAEDAETQDI